MTGPRVTAVDVTVTFDDGQSAQIAVDIEHGGASWGNDTPHLGATVDLREAIERALGAEA
jgi:hypothetical protein